MKGSLGGIYNIGGVRFQWNRSILNQFLITTPTAHIKILIELSHSFYSWQFFFFLCLEQLTARCHFMFTQLVSILFRGLAIGKENTFISLKKKQTNSAICKVPEETCTFLLLLKRFLFLYVCRVSPSTRAAVRRSTGACGQDLGLSGQSADTHPDFLLDSCHRVWCLVLS